MEGLDPLVDAHVGSHREAPQLWGAQEVSPCLSGLPLPYACLKTGFAGGYETQGLQQEGRSPTGPWAFAGHRRSHSCHRSEGSVWQSPSCSSHTQDRLQGERWLIAACPALCPKGLCCRQRRCDHGHHRQVTVKMPHMEGKHQDWPLEATLGCPSQLKDIHPSSGQLSQPGTSSSSRTSVTAWDIWL